MANFTKNAIKASFIKLLEQKPYNKITVKDIVEDCGINRNSFYYHYQDLPAVIEEIIKDESDRIIREYPSIESLEQCLEVTTEFSLSHKRAMQHIFGSANREMFEKYLMRACGYVVKAYGDTVFGDAPVSESDKNIMIRYYKCLCFGMVIDWFESGMKDDIKAVFHRLCELRKGDIDEMIRRSSGL